MFGVFSRSRVVPSFSHVIVGGGTPVAGQNTVRVPFTMTWGLVFVPNSSILLGTEDLRRNIYKI